MTTFTSTLGYSIGEQITAKATATNSQGESTQSGASTENVLAQSEPTVGVSNLTPTSTTTSITLTWDPLTDGAQTGYSSVLRYTVTHDNGTPGTTSDDVSRIVSKADDGETTTFTGLTTGTSYIFTVVATNVHGSSSANTQATYTAASVPAAPSPVVVSQTTSSTSITFTWTTSATSNGLPVDSYKMLIWKKDATPADYTENTTLCNASSPSTTTCNVPMTDLITSFGYAAGESIRAKLVAVNARGEGPRSAESNTDKLAQVAPTSAPGNFAAASTAGDVTLSWDPLPDDAAKGYSPVTDYKITYSGATNTEKTITVTDQTAISYTIANLTPAGETLTFTIKAVNIHGDGAGDTITHVLSGSAPTTLTAPTVTQSGTDVIFTWSAPSDNNGAEVTAYTLYIFDKTTTNYVDHTSKCTSYTTLDTTCTVPMTTFTSTLGYSIGEQITAKATATNSQGESTQSGASTENVLAQSEPTVGVSNLTPTSTTTSITLTWDPLTDGAQTGYSSVLRYTVTHDNGTPGTTSDDVSRIVSKADDGETTTFTGLTTGTSYIFTVVATNVHGSSSANTQATYTAASVPAAPSPVVVSQTTSSTSITFTWTTSATSNGLSVDSYKMLIWKKDATPADYTENTTLCNASSPSTTTCNVPMTDLITSFGYAAGESIRAKLVAVNARGEGPRSAESNTDKLAQVAPTSAPGNFAAASTAGDVTLSWDPLPDDAAKGYSPVTDYKITYSGATNTEKTITVTDQTAISYTIANLTPAGETLTFTIKAVNIHGDGAGDTITHVLSGSAPTTLTAPTVTQSGTDVIFTWSAPSDNNGAEVTAYTLYIFDKTTTNYVDHTSKCTSYTTLDTTCTVPMTTFTSTLGYSIGEQITAKATATNSQGESTQSGASTENVLAQSEPTVGVSNLTPTSTTTSITLTWDPLTDGAQTGYSSVLRYTVTHDNGTPGTTSDDVSRIVSKADDGETTTFTGLTTGTSYIFTVVATNVHGSSSANTQATYTAASVPAAPSPVVVSQTTSSTSITFTWTTSATSNGLSVDSYKMLIWKKDATPADYTENTTLCNASSPSTTTCNVPMTDLITSFGYAAGESIRAKLVAVNARGEGPRSAESNTDKLAQVAPTSAPGNFAAASTAGDVTLSWDPLPDDAAKGYSPVTDYKITYSGATNTEKTITVTDQTAISYTIANLTPAGETLTFTIKAVNIHGDGAGDTITHVLSGSAPTTLTAPTVTQSGTDVIFTWSAPSDNNGAEVTAYTLYIFDKTTTNYVDHTSKCTSYTTLDTTCTVPMTTFTSTLGYSIGEQITAKATATNSQGESTQSGASTENVLAQSEPTVGVSNLTPTSTTTSITLTWDPLTDGAQTGYSSVLRYTVTHDNGTPGTTSDDVSRIVSKADDGETTTFTGLTTGTSYIFTVVATNVHGSSSANTQATYTAASVPAAPSPVVVSQTTSSTSITFTWTTSATSNGLSVDSYKMLIWKKDATPADYTENTTLCNASSPSTTTCNVPMTDLITSFGYAAGESIRAKLVAVNARGEGPRSAESNTDKLAQVGTNFSAR